MAGKVGENWGWLGTAETAGVGGDENGGMAGGAPAPREGAGPGIPNLKNSNFYSGDRYE